MFFFFFFFNDTATTEIYTLSLHDALPICNDCATRSAQGHCGFTERNSCVCDSPIENFEGRLIEIEWLRSEEHTSELQSPCNLVCRLLLEKKKNSNDIISRCLQRADGYIIV